jgi:predicted nucleotidyltransferase
LLPILDPHTKKIENTKSQKNNSSEKRMLGCPENGQNWLRRFKNTKIEI